MLNVEIVLDGGTNKFSLEDGEHTVGRSRENPIQLPSVRVSKKHAAIRVDGERMFVRDLGSRNGTELNGKPLGGDWVEVPPGSLVSFAGALMRRATPAAGPLASVTGAHHLLGDHQVATSLRYNISQGYSPVAQHRLMGRIQQLFELLASSDDAGAIETAACRFVAETLPAERVVLLSDSGEGTEVAVRSRWTKGGDADAPLQLSSSIVGSVTKERDSVLVANPQEDPRFGGQQSIMALSLRSAMAAPLFDNQRVRGILYVDTTDSRVRYSQADLEVLTAAANAVAIKLRNLSLEREISGIREQLKLAAKIQQDLLPKTTPSIDGYDLAACSLAAQVVGGDYYDFIHVKDGRWVVCLGDVSGKGLPASLLMANLQATLRGLSALDSPVGQTISRSNRLIYHSTDPEKFATLFAGVLDLERDSLTFCNAGHEEPILLRAGGGEERLATGGMALGVMDEFPYGEGEIRMKTDDILIIYSDGVTDAVNATEQPFGEERLIACAREATSGSAESIMLRIVAAVREHEQGTEPVDDVTIIVVKRAESANVTAI